MSAATNNRVYVQSADKDFRVNKVLVEDGVKWNGILFSGYWIMSDRLS